MIDNNNFLTGYTLVAFALLFVLVYFVVVSLMLRAPRRKNASVARYQPPRGASPAVAAWLCERGRLPRAMAAAIVNMAAKGYLKIGQIEDLVSLTKLAEGSSAQLEPEEDALSRLLFQSVDYFEFVEPLAQLAAAAKAFRWALLDTEYFSPHTELSAPAWAISVVAMFFAFFQGDYFLGHGSFRILEYAGFATFGGFVLAIRTLSGTIEKIGSRIPGSAAPQRPWTSADTRPIIFLAVALAGTSVIAAMTTTIIGLLLAAFLVLNLLFYFALQGPTSKGREILAQIDDYKKFLSEVDADEISRVRSAGRVPDQLQAKDAYAIAFHIDLGWGEQFVTSIADVIERAELYDNVKNDDRPALLRL